MKNWGGGSMEKKWVVVIGYFNKKKGGWGFIYIGYNMVFFFFFDFYFILLGFRGI